MAIDGRRLAAVDARDVIARYVPRISQFGTALAGSKRRFVWPADDQGSEEAVVTAPIGLILQEDPLILCAITVPKPNTSGAMLVTAYPAPREGITRRMVVRDLEEDCLGLEGWIHAETESEVPISFFATDYFIHPERYATGSAIEVSLSGLAYSMQAAASREIVIDDPERIRRLDLAQPEGEPIRINTAGAAILLPVQDWQPFEYKFQGTLKRHKRILHNARPFNQLSITVARGGDDDIDILVLAADHVLRNEIPSFNADVAGSMCVMGRLADFDWPETPHFISEPAD